MKFKIREEELMRRVMDYEVEADSLDEAKELARQGGTGENEYFTEDECILISISEGDEEVWSGDYTELEG